MHAITTFVSDTLKTIAAPALGLLGTVIVAFVGYRQWRKQQDQVRYGNFLADRQAAYKQLWQKLEAVHLNVRSKCFQEAEFNALVRDVNVHLIQAGLLLDQGEKKRVNEYMEALSNLGKLLDNAAATEAREEVRRSLYDTGEIAPEIMSQVAGLRDAYARVEVCRGTVMSHFRQVLGADLFQ